MLAADPSDLCNLIQLMNLCSHPHPPLTFESVQIYLTYNCVGLFTTRSNFLPLFLYMFSVYLLITPSFSLSTSRYHFLLLLLLLPLLLLLLLLLEKCNELQATTDVCAHVSRANLVKKNVLDKLN